MLEDLAAPIRNRPVNEVLPAELLDILKITKQSLGRVLTELTAQRLRIDTLIATEVELVDGKCTGRTSGTLNMREGKLARLQSWLRVEGWPETALSEAVFYSDSSNDLPLLRAVGEPIAVDPDPKLREEAVASRWQIMELPR